MNPAAHAGDKKHESKFKVKAALESKIDIQNNRDLDSGRDDSLSVLDPELSVGILYRATNYFEIFSEIEASRKFTLAHGDDISSPSHDRELNLKQIYFNLEDWPFDNLDIRLGRQEFEDEREWLYDEELDGLHLFYKQSIWSAELSASRLSTFRKNLLNDRPARAAQGELKRAAFADIIDPLSSEVTLLSSGMVPQIGRAHV